MIKINTQSVTTKNVSQVKYFFCFLLLALLFIFPANLFAQTNQLGIPLLRNYEPAEYEGDPHNWTVVRDNRGIYYFGTNQSRIREFDGKSWVHIPVKTNANIRSLCTGDDGIVYVGSNGDFGRLVPNALGKIEYQSLTHLVQDEAIRKKITDAEFLKTYLYQGNIYFFSQQYIFVFDGTSISVINTGETTGGGRRAHTFFINSRFFTSTVTSGLFEIKDSSKIQVPNSEILLGKQVVFILPYSENIALIATRNKEFFLFDMINSQFTVWELKGKLNQRLKSEIGELYCGLKLSNGNYGIGFLNVPDCSFIEVDNNGNVLKMLNMELGLNDSRVHGMYQENIAKNSKPLLWLALGEGIATYDIHSPLRQFNKQNGLSGVIKDIAVFNNRLYVATMNGLFVQDVDDLGVAHFTPVKNINRDVWSLLVLTDPVTKEQNLLAGVYNGGIFNIKGNNAEHLSTLLRRNRRYLFPYTMEQSQKYPDRIHLGMRDSLCCLEYKNNQFNYSGKLVDLKGNEIHSIAECGQYLWCTSSQKNSYRIKLSNLEKGGVPEALPIDFLCIVKKVGNRIYLFAENEVFEHDEINDKIIKSPVFDKLTGSEVNNIVRFNDGYAVAMFKNNRYIINLIKKNDTENSSYNPFVTVPSNVKIDALFVNDTVLYFSSTSNLYIYNLNDTLTYDKLNNDKPTFDISIRRVTIGDSIIFYGTFFTEENNKISILNSQPQNKIPKIKYDDNYLQFEYSAQWYLQPRRTQYSYRMVGLYDWWSDWSNDSKSNFTNLREGKYTFQVKAKNLYGLESDIASYSFVILPPWYRTVYAYILYVLLAGGLFYLVLKIYTRRLVAEKERLEKIVAERTAEVVARNKELHLRNEEILAQNEEIRAQKEEIEAQNEIIVDQNENIKKSVTYASKIQKAVLPPDEMVSKIFPDSFVLYLPRDIVSGDFYWTAEIENRKYCAVADCTGHGVPGGFMSMMGLSFLNEIVGNDNSLTAGEVLDRLRANIIKALRQTGKIDETKDGMDIALYIIDIKAHEVQFAGAYNPLVLIRNNEIIIHKADRMPAGIYHLKDNLFTTQTFEIQKGDVLYTFSDGYIDQFGGPNSRKYLSKNFNEFLLQIHQKPMQEQRTLLYQNLIDWMGHHERIDDIVVMGYRY